LYWGISADRFESELVGLNDAPGEDGPGFAASA
jgi:hypothetical protein